ncbi:MAG: hypothetical protein PHD08_05040 [Synergistaceae bacterium]|nr:hypothetical protein [Synergistaceae bacterium]
MTACDKTDNPDKDVWRDLTTGAYANLDDSELKAKEKEPRASSLKRITKLDSSHPLPDSGTIGATTSIKILTAISGPLTPTVTKKHSMSLCIVAMKI